MDPATAPRRGTDSASAPGCRTDPAPPHGRGDPLIAAHRGVWGGAAQNSLAALEAAIELGCDMVEIDVRRTRDKRLVAVHDNRIAGTTVSELDHEDRKAVMGFGHQAPLLVELLAAAAGRVALDIELKEDGYAEQVAGTLARYLACSTIAASPR